MSVASRNTGGPFTYVVDAQGDLATIVGPKVGEDALVLSDGTLWYHTGSAWAQSAGGGGGGGAPTDADYLVGTANASLSAEIVVGTSPGGELGGTWASPTVDATHSGSSHAGVVSTHEAAADPHTGYVQESLVDAKGDLITATADNTPARLAVGSDFSDQLVPDSSASTGLRWGFRRNACRPRAALYESAPRNTQLNGTRTPTSQTLCLVGIDLPNGLTIASISFASAGTALVTGAHQIFGLYDDDLGSSSGTGLALLRGTSDDTNTAWGSNTVKTLSLTSTYTTTRSGFFYLGVLVDAATPPTLAAYTISAAIQAQAPIIGGNSSTGQTSLPNPAAALGNQTTVPYAYVS